MYHFFYITKTQYFCLCTVSDKCRGTYCADKVSDSISLKDTAVEQTLGVTGKPTVTLITKQAFGIWFSNFTAHNMQTY